MALPLYLITTAAILLAWDRRIQRVPRVAAIVLVLMPLVFTGRAMLTNRVYAPADIAFVAEPLRDYASDYGVAAPHNIQLSDLHAQILPWQRAVRHALANGQWPLWNPFILCGDILAAAAQPAVYDPFQWIGMLIPLRDAFTFGAALTFFLAGFFTWAFARALGMNDTGAFVAAAGFMFCGMMAFFVGWPLGRAWAYLPLELVAARRLVHEEKAGLLTLAFALLIVAGHPESVLHVVAAGAVYGAFEWFAVRRAKPVALAIASGAIALLLTAVYLLPFFEAVPQTLEHFIRQDMYATQTYDVLARPHVQLARMKKTFVPGFRDGDPLSARVGPIVLALALAGAVLRWRRRETWFFVVLAVISLLATFGTWPVAHALHALPLFDIAINERLAFAAAFALAMLAGLAVDSFGVRQSLLPLSKRWLRPPHSIILAIVLLSRTWEDGRIYPALPRDAFFPRIPLIAAVPRDGRVVGHEFAFTGNNPTMYGLEDARGYQAMTNRRLYETYPLWSTYQTAWYNRVDDLSRPFLSFLDVRYAIGRRDPPAGWRVMKEDRGTRLFENMNALPRAFVPSRIRYERDGAAVVKAMQSATGFSQVAWIEAPEYAPHEIANGPGLVTLRRSGLAYDLDVSMEHDGWVVVSATAWKGWRAHVDGHRIEPRFANHAFLGVFVPKGSHRVTLDYLPRSFATGRNISLITLALLFFCRIAPACRRFFSTSPSQSR